MSRTGAIVVGVIALAAWFALGSFGYRTGYSLGPPGSPLDFIDPEFVRLVITAAVGLLATWLGKMPWIEAGRKWLVDLWPGSKVDWLRMEKQVGELHAKEFPPPLNPPNPTP